MPDNSHGAGSTWLLFAFLTVVSWGVYGVFLHTGQTSMAGGDPAAARYRAFLFVGLAYFLTAVLAPLFLLMLKGAAFSGYTAKGMAWSLVAGIVGAIGAFGVLLAFGAGGKPGVVMSIVFAGAPVVNAIYSIIAHPPAGGWGSIRWPFYLGIVLAATGGCLVTFFKPAPPAPGKPPLSAGPMAAAVSQPR
ncbi:MAG TPA: hypothetical protein VNO52_05955 [Methylomirabilota bacterium]|nr:hypothetical protein [Methylomirabilota bacterium]